MKKIFKKTAGAKIFLSRAKFTFLGFGFLTQNFLEIVDRTSFNPS